MVPYRMVSVARSISEEVLHDISKKRLPTSYFFENKYFLGTGVDKDKCLTEAGRKAVLEILRDDIDLHRGLSKEVFWNEYCAPMRKGEQWLPGAECEMGGLVPGAASRQQRPRADSGLVSTAASCRQRPRADSGLAPRAASCQRRPRAGWAASGVRLGSVLSSVGTLRLSVKKTYGALADRASVSRVEEWLRTGKARGDLSVGAHPQPAQCWWRRSLLFDENC